MNKKVEQQRILKYLWFLQTKKVYIGSFIKARPDPDPDPQH
jgi:hypothetical protein